MAKLNTGFHKKILKKKKVMFDSKNGVTIPAEFDKKKNEFVAKKTVGWKSE